MGNMGEGRQATHSEPARPTATALRHHLRDGASCRAAARLYKRAHFEEAWAAYCPGQNPSPQPTGTSKARRRASADEMGITSDFQGVRETSPHASKNANLSHSHAGLHARTFRNTESGDEGDS